MPPWQSGQSGQPSPDPVTRTTPPKITSPNTDTKEAKANPETMRDSGRSGPGFGRLEP